ncbi:MAG: hypothetical protein ABSB76_16590 [Streptosporangiaceae bacterium]
MSERLDRERDEIRSAIDWALQTDDAETVGQLLTPLFTYWWSRGLLPMTSELAEQAAAMPSAASLSPYASALLLAARGISMVMIGRATEAEPLLRRTLETAISLGNRWLAAYALLGLGGALVRHALGEACERLDDAARTFREIDDRWGLALTLSTCSDSTPPRSATWPPHETATPPPPNCISACSTMKARPTACPGSPDWR